VVMRTQLRAYGILGLVFLLGMAAGGGVMHACEQRVHRRHLMERPDASLLEFRMAALTRRLGLSDDQATKIRAILMRRPPPPSEELRQTMARCREPIDKMRAEHDQQIRAVLSEEQQRQFDEILKQRRLGIPPGFGPP
jgi:hypothetical protein